MPRAIDSYTASLDYTPTSTINKSGPAVRNERTSNADTDYNTTIEAVQQSALTDYNVALEGIQLLALRDEQDIQKMKYLEEDMYKVQEELFLMKYFLERFSKLEREGKDKEEVEIDEELQGKISFFQNECWPRLLERNQGIDIEAQNPFPYGEKMTKVRVLDIIDIKTRLSNLATEQEFSLGNNVRELQRMMSLQQVFALMASHTISIQTKWTKNQRTG